jgi:hypothetical protein
VVRTCRPGWTAPRKETAENRSVLLFFNPLPLAWGIRDYDYDFGTLRSIPDDGQPFPNLVREGLPTPELAATSGTGSANLAIGGTHLEVNS